MDVVSFPNKTNALQENQDIYAHKCAKCGKQAQQKKSAKGVLWECKWCGMAEFWVGIK